MEILLFCNFDTKKVTACITAFVAIITIIKGLCEYDDYKRRNRIQYLLDKFHNRWPDLQYEKEFWNVYRSFVENAKNFN